MSASTLAQANGMPVIVFLKQHDSHIFSDRTILYNGEVKVGRAVAKLRASPNNAIFDCKVLSRSHAVILYEDKRFILRDTNSSNGTFVNNVRINKDGDANYGEREIFSGDFIRFGVEVLENGTNHGCIITQVKLYHPNGAEAIQRDADEPVIECLSNEQLFQLASHVNESIFRERTIQKKIDDLKTLLEETKEMSDKSWTAMLDEERLLDKLDLYENQLRIFKTDLPNESLQAKLLTAFEEKSEFEQNSKKILEKRLEEKTKALLKVTELENSLADSEREVKLLRESLDTSKEAYQSVSNSLEVKLKEIEILHKKLTETSNQKVDLETKLHSTSQEYHALKDHMNNSKTSQELEKTQAKILELEKETERLKGLLKENDEASKDLKDRALAEIEALDRFIDMQDDLSGKERSLEKMLEAAHGKVMSSLAGGAKQLTESMRFIQQLQAELAHVEAIAANSKQTPPAPPFVKKEDNSDETEVSSSANHIEPVKFENSLASAILKVRELTNQLAESHVKTENSLSNYLEYLSENEGRDPATREEGDGLSDKVTDNGENYSLGVKEKLGDLNACSAVAKLSESQFLDYQKRIKQNEDDSDMASYSMISSTTSSALAYSQPIKSVNDHMMASAPMAASEDEADDEEINGLDSQQGENGLVPRKDYRLVTMQLNATKQDLASLQEALRQQKLENAEFKEIIEKLKSERTAETASAEQTEKTSNLEALTRDHQELTKKIDQVQQDLALSKKQYMDKIQEATQLKHLLEEIRADRDNLKTRFERAQEQISSLEQRSPSVEASVSNASTDDSARPVNPVFSHLTIVVVMSVMALLLAFMSSILSRFTR